MPRHHQRHPCGRIIGSPGGGGLVCGPWGLRCGEDAMQEAPEKHQQAVPARRHRPRPQGRPGRTPSSFPEALAGDYSRPPSASREEEDGAEEGVG